MRRWEGSSGHARCQDDSSRLASHRARARARPRALWSRPTAATGQDAPADRPRPRGAFAGLALFAATIGLGACQERFPKVPGETDVEVEEVEILPAEGATELALDHAALFERLGQRPQTLLISGRTWSPFREAEDRRRIEAYWQQFGYFDVEVSPAEVSFDPEDGSATVRYRVREHERYKVGKVRLEHAPEAEREGLEELIFFAEGETEIDLERFRKVRVAMQMMLRRAGYAHANAYSRTYLDESRRLLHIYYFVDAGPATHLGSVVVDGAAKIPDEDVIRRSGLRVGEPFFEGQRDQVVRDLLDTGAYTAAYVRVDADTKYIVPGTAPDTGGELRDEQVDAEGNLVPRQLPAAINAKIHVVEAPSRTLRLRAGFEIDPSRADTALAATLWLRNLLGPLHHLVTEGRVGYGYVFGSGYDHAGVYGEGLIRTIHPGVLGRTGDMRTTIRYEGMLFPLGFLHRATTGLGARTTFFDGLFLETDLLAYLEKSEDFGPYTDAERAELALPAGDLAVGPELDASLVWDGRNDPIEPMAGTFASLTARLSPFDLGSPADHPFVNLAPDARLFVPLAAPVSLAFRVSGEWSLLAEGDGIPFGARTFGGGSYGFRGFGWQWLSPTATQCVEGECRAQPVGGRSLFESSVELRWLPPLKQYGAVVFADAGEASGDLNPFSPGISMAAGLGFRLRLWYVPAALDFAYRILRDSNVQEPADEPFNLFLRIGEAF